jgi:hypothetical protein
VSRYSVEAVRVERASVFVEADSPEAAVATVKGFIFAGGIQFAQFWKDATMSWQFKATLK